MRQNRQLTEIWGLLVKRARDIMTRRHLAGAALLALLALLAAAARLYEGRFEQFNGQMREVGTPGGGHTTT